MREEGREEGKRKAPVTYLKRQQLLVLPLDGLQLGGRVVEVGPAGVDPGGRVPGAQHLVLQASG